MTRRVIRIGHVQRDRSHTLFLVVGIVIGALWVKACEAMEPAAAQAQEPPEHVTLGQVCAHEAGWQRGADCAAIMEVIHRVQSARRHRTFRQAAALYASNALTGRGRSNRWSSDLSEDGHRPRYWPRHLPWDRGRNAYVCRWLRLLEYAWSLLHGKDWLPCGVLAEDWASRTFTANAVRGAWVQLHCGHTVDLFWRRRTTEDR